MRSDISKKKILSCQIKAKKGFSYQMAFHLIKLKRQDTKRKASKNPMVRELLDRRHLLDTFISF